MSIEEWFNNISEKQVSKWGTWKADAQEAGVIVEEDKSGFDDTTTLTKDEANTAFLMCTITITSIDAQQRVDEWTKEYDLLIKTPPAPNDYLVTCDGSRVKLD